jgi:hypothetical protein
MVAAELMSLTQHEHEVTDGLVELELVIQLSPKKRSPEQTKQSDASADARWSKNHEQAGLQALERACNDVEGGLAIVTVHALIVGSACHIQ